MTTTTLPARAAGHLGLRPRSRAAFAYLVAGAVSIAVYYVLPSDAQSIAFVVIGLSTAAAMVVAPRRNPVGQPLPWYWFAAGILLEVAGAAIFAAYEIHLDREPPV